MEDNRLLAEYLVLPHMEVKQSKTYGEYVTYADGQYKNVWRPDQDWNQLMMVVEKIEKDDEVSVQIFKTTCNVCDEFAYDHFTLNDKIDNIIHLQASSRKEAVYNACVEYIKNRK